MATEVIFKKVEGFKVEKYLTQNEDIRVKGLITQKHLQKDGYVCFMEVNNSFKISYDLVDEGGELQTQLDQVALGLPPILTIPVLKYANGVVIDEGYLKGTLSNGRFTAEADTGKMFTSSGNYMLHVERINKAINQVGISWSIEADDLSIRVL